MLAFAPINAYGLAFITPALLLWCWKNATPRQAFSYGLLFGLGVFGVGTSWVYVSIHHFGNAPVSLAGLITLLFIFILALYPACQGYTWRKIFRNKTPAVQYLIAFPLTWVFFEWLREVLFTGFPWLFLGYSQTYSLLHAYAPIIGVYGLSFLVALINGAIILKKIGPWVGIGAVVLAAWPLSHHAWTRPIGMPLSVALVQGNIPQQAKWDPFQIRRGIDRYRQVAADYSTDLMVWPEAAIPLTAQDIPGLIRQLDTHAKQRQSTLFFGIPTCNTEKTHYYNSIMAVGVGVGQYDKRHLVPFGEYIPLAYFFNRFMAYFDIPMSHLSPGSSHQALLTMPGINTPVISIAPFICYEMAYPVLALHRSEGSHLLVVINDDSWFGESWAAEQQIQMAALRAVETGRYVLYASNTGITGIISPSGRLVQSVPQRIFTVLTGYAQPMEGKTPLMKYGYYPWVACCLILFAISLL